MRNIAWRQLLSLKRRIDANPQLRTVYRDEIKKIIQYEKELDIKTRDIKMADKIGIKTESDELL